MNEEINMRITIPVVLLLTLSFCPARNAAANQTVNCKITCPVKTNADGRKRGVTCTDTATGEASGASEPSACADAKNAATRTLPRGCYMDKCPSKCECELVVAKTEKTEKTKAKDRRAQEQEVRERERGGEERQEGTPRNNQEQNKMFEDATRGMTKEQKKIVHDAITGQNYDFHKIKEIADIVRKGGRP